VTRTEVPKQGGTLLQVICDKPATLLPLGAGDDFEPRACSPGRPAAEG